MEEDHPKWPNSVFLIAAAVRGKSGQALSLIYRRDFVRGLADTSLHLRINTSRRLMLVICQIKEDRRYFLNFVMNDKIPAIEFATDDCSWCLLRRLPRPKDVPLTIYDGTRRNCHLGGHPSRYYPGPMLLDFSEQMGTSMSRRRSTPVPILGVLSLYDLSNCGKYFFDTCIFRFVSTSRPRSWFSGWLSR
jgi:hypothetical protein